jgi:hypothetical protein
MIKARLARNNEFICININSNANTLYIGAIIGFSHDLASYKSSHYHFLKDRLLGLFLFFSGELDLNSILRLRNRAPIRMPKGSLWAHFFAGRR